MDVKKDVIKSIRAQKPAKEMTKKLEGALKTKIYANFGGKLNLGKK